MPVRIEYKKSVHRDLKRIGEPHSTRILDRLEEFLSANPDKGEKLEGQYQGLYKLRVGDYRVVYSKTKAGILVLRIRHRKHAYR